MLDSFVFLPFISATLKSSSEQINFPNFNDQTMRENFNKTNESKLKNIKLNIPYVNQKDDLKDTEYEKIGGSACGPATITMALKSKGENIDLKKVIDELPDSVYVKGKMFYDLTAGPKYFGFKAIQIEPTIKSVYETLKTGEPILMNIQNYDGVTGHEVLVVGIKNYSEETKSADSLIVHDPFREAYREFPIISEHYLEQPEGYKLFIGTLKPFYIEKASLASN